MALTTYLTKASLMALIVSVALTLALVSPVFVLAGWLKSDEPAPVRARFNARVRPF